MSFKFLFPLLAMLVFCVLLCVFVFQILNKREWEVLAMISWNKKQKRTPGGIISITYAIFTAWMPLLCYDYELRSIWKTTSCFSKSFIVLLLPDQVAFHFIVNLAFYLSIILAKAYAQKHLSNLEFIHFSDQSFWNTK